MITVALAAIGTWLLIMTFLLMPSMAYSNGWDRLTKARWRKDREGLELMLNHFRNFPEEWSVSRDGISFPKEGAKQIMLGFDREKSLEYSLSSGGFRPLKGHYGVQFLDSIERENARRESQVLIRHLYPELNGTLMLGHSR